MTMIVASRSPRPAARPELTTVLNVLSRTWRRFAEAAVAESSVMGAKRRRARCTAATIARPRKTPSLSRDVRYTANSNAVTRSKMDTTIAQTEVWLHRGIIWKRDKQKAAFLDHGRAERPTACRPGASGLAGWRGRGIHRPYLRLLTKRCICSDRAFAILMRSPEQRRILSRLVPIRSARP